MLYDIIYSYLTQYMRRSLTYNMYCVLKFYLLEVEIMFGNEIDSN